MEKYDVLINPEFWLGLGVIFSRVHMSGIVHNDAAINMGVDQDGNPCVIDFGNTPEIQRRLSKIDFNRIQTVPRGNPFAPIESYEMPLTNVRPQSDKYQLALAALTTLTMQFDENHIDQSSPSGLTNKSKELMAQNLPNIIEKSRWRKSSKQILAGFTQLFSGALAKNVSQRIQDLPDLPPDELDIKLKEEFNIPLYTHKLTARQRAWVVPLFTEKFAHLLSGGR